MADINLLQNKLGSSTADIKTGRLLDRVEFFTAALLILSIFIGAGFLGGKVYLQRKEESFTREIVARRVELEKVSQERRDKAVTVQAEIKNMNELLPHHLYWTNMIKSLNAAAISGVQFTNITATGDGNVTLSGLANDYPTLAAFIKKLNETKYVDQVILNSSTLSELTSRVFYRFTIAISFDPTIFNYQPQ